MKLNEIKSKDAHGWDVLLDETVRELKQEFGDVSFTGGYCFHLALALFLKAKRDSVEIITDGGHAALYDYTHDVSVDVKGIHKYEDALDMRATRRWTDPKKFMKAVQRGWSSDEQIERLNQTYDKYK